MRETAGNSERTPSDASASTRGRSVEVRLDIGRLTVNFQHDVRREQESCVKHELFSVVSQWSGGRWRLTCGIHREEVVFGQLLFLVEFGDLVADEISHGVHQTGEGDRSRADATSSRRQDLVLPIPSHRIK